MPETIKDRLAAYLAAKKVNKSEFGRRIGVSSSYISSMRKSIQPDKVASIAREFPDLNMSWLMTGEGPMLISPAVPPEPSVSAAPKLQPDALSLDVLVRKIAEQAEEIGRLKAENAALKTLHKE